MVAGCRVGFFFLHRVLFVDCVAKLIVILQCRVLDPRTRFARSGSRRSNQHCLLRSRQDLCGGVTSTSFDIAPTAVIFPNPDFFEKQEST